MNIPEIQGKVFFGFCFVLFCFSLMNPRDNAECPGTGVECGHVTLIPPGNTWPLTDWNFSTLCPAVFVAATSV